MGVKISEHCSFCSYDSSFFLAQLFRNVPCDSPCKSLDSLETFCYIIHYIWVASLPHEALGPSFK